MPPLTSGSVAATSWSGVTDRPWPKAMVMVFSFCQWVGMIGAAVSPSSVGMRSIKPSFLRKAR